MKYFSRLKLYKASNVTFDAENIVAKSYSWWTFVRVYNGKVIFNKFPYSRSTIKHQYKVKALMQQLGIKIDLEISTPKSLHCSDAVKAALELLDKEKAELLAKINAPRTRKAKNLDRIDRIEYINFMKSKIKAYLLRDNSFYSLVQS